MAVTWLFAMLLIHTETEQHLADFKDNNQNYSFIPAKCNVKKLVHPKIVALSLFYLLSIC